MSNYDNVRKKMLDDQAFNRLQEEARIANELQAWGVSRTQALQIAKEALDNAEKQR